MGNEEELAREAIAQIRGWIGREEKGQGGNFFPRLSFKFCGGCNPHTERGVVAQGIREGLAEIVQWVSLEERPDLVLIINGCLTSCADRAEIQEHARAILTLQGNIISGIEKNPSPDDPL